MSRGGRLVHVNGASHEAGQLRISFTQFGKSNPRDASFTDHSSTTQYGREASPVHSSPIVEYKSIVSKSFFMIFEATLKLKPLKQLWPKTFSIPFPKKFDHCSPQSNYWHRNIDFWFHSSRSRRGEIRDAGMLICCAPKRVSQGKAICKEIWLKIKKQMKTGGSS